MKKSIPFALAEVIRNGVHDHWDEPRMHRPGIARSSIKHLVEDVIFDNLSVPVTELERTNV